MTKVASYVNKSQWLNPLLLGLLFSITFLVRDVRKYNDVIILLTIWLIFAGFLATSLAKKDIAEIAGSRRVRNIVVITSWVLLETMMLDCIIFKARVFSISETSLIGLAPAFVILLAYLNGQISSLDFKKIEFCLTTIVVFIAINSIIFTLLNKDRQGVFFIDFNASAALFLTFLVIQAVIICTATATLFNYLSFSIITLAHALSVSRGSNLLLILSFFIIFLVYRPKKNIVLSIALIVLMTQGFVATLPFSLRGSSSSTADFLLSPKTVSITDKSAHSRLQLWRSTLDAYVHEREWFGTGIGTFPLIYPSYRSISETSSSGGRAHNDYIEKFLEGGPILAVLMVIFGLVLPISALSTLLKKIKRDNDNPDVKRSEHLLKIGAALCALCLGLNACVTFVFCLPPLSFIFALNIFKSIDYDDLSTPMRSIFLINSKETIFNKLLLFSSLFAVIFLCFGLFLFILSLWLIDNKISNSQSIVGYLPIISLGASLQPSNGQYQLLLLDIEFESVSGAHPDKRLLIQATRDIFKWIDADERDPRAWEKLAQLSALAPQEAKGITPAAAYGMALKLRPDWLSTRVMFAEELKSQGLDDAAYDVLRGGFNWVSIQPSRELVRRWGSLGLSEASKLNKTDDFEMWKWATSV